MFGKALLKLFILMLILISSPLSAQQLFVKNVGQWDSDIMYAGSGAGYQIVIAQSGIYINHQQVNKAEECIDEFGNKRNEALLSSDNLRLHFAGSEIKDQIQENIISGRISPITFDFWNYGPNRDWFWDVPCYEEIIISNIYPDISMKFYYEGDNIRYDFELGESANSNQIKMLVQGSQSGEIIDNELIIKTKLGEIRNGKIKTFINSNGQEIPTSINMNKTGEIQFDLAEYNKEEKITIDPLVYSSYLYNQTAIAPDYGFFNIDKRGDEYWMRVWEYNKLNFYTDTINYSDVELVYPETIIVYESDFKQIKKYIVVSYVGTNKIIFPDENHLLITLLVPEEKFSMYNIVNSEIRDELCLVRINFTEKKIEKGIQIPPNGLANIYLSSDSRIILSYNESGSSKTLAYLTDNSYFSGCDSSFSKDCFYPYFLVISSDLQDIEFATLIPYSIPTSRAFMYVRMSDILSDSKGNIYFINRVPYNFVDKYDNFIGNWTGTNTYLHAISSHYTTIYKFDRDYNMVKSVAVGFTEARHFLIDKNDELIIIGNVNKYFQSELLLHDDCLKPTIGDWNNLSTQFHNKIGIIKLNSDLEYLRSGIIPGGYFINLLEITTAAYPANLGSDALLDEENNIYITHGIANYYYNAYNTESSENFKIGNTDYGVETDKHNYDVGLMKVKSDLTKILYSTVYGGAGDDAPGFMFVQDTLVTIIGTTGSTDLVVTPDADVNYPHNPTERLFVVTLNTNSPVSVMDSTKDKPYIYPNPAYSYIELPESLTNRYALYSIHDLPGRTLVTKRLQDYRIDISFLPRGTYNLILTNDTDIVSYLFVKTE
ncbi:MAG: T9SS type A sorting domain-containing protein [Desulfobulbaceae bacterium]|nr:T9SS type A sorting domain-containing protein [Desulfobulbaceae bacterium]